MLIMSPFQGSDYFSTISTISTSSTSSTFSTSLNLLNLPHSLLIASTGINLAAFQAG
jgi:hypothetical protein